MAWFFVWGLLAAAVIGIINPAYVYTSFRSSCGGLIFARSKEFGPFRAFEESTLAQLIPAAARSDIYAWYNVVGSAGAVLGTTLLWLGGAIT